MSTSSSVLCCSSCSEFAGVWGIFRLWTVYLAAALPHLLEQQSTRSVWINSQTDRWTTNVWIQQVQQEALGEPQGNSNVLLLILQVQVLNENVLNVPLQVFFFFTTWEKKQQCKCITSYFLTAMPLYADDYRLCLWCPQIDLSEQPGQQRPAPYGEENGQGIGSDCPKWVGWTYETWLTQSGSGCFNKRSSFVGLIISKQETMAVHHLQPGWSNCLDGRQSSNLVLTAVSAEPPAQIQLLVQLNLMAILLETKCQRQRSKVINKVDPSVEPVSDGVYG